MMIELYFSFFILVFGVSLVLFYYAYFLKLMPALESEGVSRISMTLKLLVPAGIMPLFNQYREVCSKAGQPLFWANYLCWYPYYLIAFFLLFMIGYIPLCDDCPNFR